MPGKCCVPGCRSNYDKTDPYFSVFSFPNNYSLREKWIRAINREPFALTKHSYVCSKHFSENEIIQVDKMIRDDGSTLEIPRKIPKLIKGAVPTIFPEQLVDLSTQKPSFKRKNPDDRSRDSEICDEISIDDEISNYDEFVLKFKERNLSDFLFQISDEHVCFFIIETAINTSPKIVSGFNIDKNLKVLFFAEGKTVCCSKFSKLLGKEDICNKWSQFDSLLSHMSSLDKKFKTEI